MSDISRLLSLRSGIHASTSDLTAIPGVLRPLEMRGPDVPAGLFPRSRAEVDRPLIAPDGRRFPFAFGAKDISPLTLGFEFRGVNANTGGAVADWEAKQELGHLLQSLFGAAPATTGVALTCSGVAGVTLTLSGSTYQNNDVILFTTTTGPVARRIISGGATVTVTLDRAFTGTPSGAVIRGARYTAVPSQTEHVPLYLDAEGTTVGGVAWRQQLLGCFPQSLVVTVPDTGLVQLDATFAPNDWLQPAAASPGYAAPVAGAPAAASNVQFFDGADLLDVSGAKLTYSTGGIMKPTASGPNGVRGGAGTNKRDVMLEFDHYLGGFTGEKRYGVGAAPLANLGTAGALANGTVQATRSLLLHVGSVAGSTIAAWIPEAVVISTIVANGDFTVERCKAYATGPVPLVLAVF